MFGVQALVAAVAIGVAWGWAGGALTGVLLIGLGAYSFRGGAEKAVAHEQSPAPV
jgi:hypothetical protein